MAPVSSPTPTDTIDILIQGEDDRLHLDARIYEQPIRRYDPIHTLNDFFLTLSYLYTRLSPAHYLIHCSAYTLGGENTLLLGDKKSGKSYAATLRGLTDGCFIADDLLLWNYKTGFFKTIGLPPRLRRPVPDEILRAIPADDFLAGQDLAYVKKGSYKGMDAGIDIAFDTVRVFQSPQDHLEVPLMDYAKEINKRRIDDTLWAYKKDHLSG